MSAQPDDSTDTVSIEALRTENQALRAENQLLRDEIARLKGLPPRPPAKPRRSSGLETATDPSRSKRRKGRRQTRGAKRDSHRVTRDVIVTAAAPAGSRFKGYETLLVRDVALSAEVLRYRRERWVTPAGEPIVAPVPTGIVGGYGANLRRFCLVLHAQGQMTTERLTAILNGIGVEISKRQVVRLLTANLDTFVEEDRQVLRAGLQSAPFITVDDTSARHARRDGVTTQIGGERFTAFRTGWSKSRQAFLSPPSLPVAVARGSRGLRDQRRGAALHARAPTGRPGDRSAQSASGPILPKRGDLADTPEHARDRHLERNPTRGHHRHRGRAVGCDPASWALEPHRDRVRRRRPVPFGPPRPVLDSRRALGASAGAGGARTSASHRDGTAADLVVLPRPQGVEDRPVPPPGQRLEGAV